MRDKYRKLEIREDSKNITNSSKNGLPFFDVQIIILSRVNPLGIYICIYYEEVFSVYLCAVVLLNYPQHTPHT